MPPVTSHLPPQSTMKQLCKADRAILNSLFNPLLPLGEGVEEEDTEPHTVVEESQDASTHCPEAAARSVAGVRATEQGRHEEALGCFAEALELAPRWAAAYNNRAQLYRIMRKEEEAVEDLDKAIELSEGKGKVACQAYLQRGLLHRLQQQDQQAIKCFTEAASLGSNFAKTQLVALNPMAALCNQMLVRMVTELQVGGNQE